MTDNASVDLDGTWTVEWIGDRPVIDSSPAAMTFGAENRLAGNASCNQFFATFALNGDQLTITLAGVTRKLCPPALLEQEQRFLAAVEAVARAEIRNGLLYLYDVDQRACLRASQRSVKDT
jgi:heat shock protein HslJ